MNSQIELGKLHPDLIFELRTLARKADKAKPDKSDVVALTVFLNQHPEFWRVCGDLTEQAAGIMLADMNAPRSMKESLQVGMAHMAAELTQPGDGEMERLIIRQIVGCWLRLSYVEYVYGRAVIAGQQTLNQADFWERRLSAAQRRYLRAAESLARVRRMNLPAMQVNIAAQQINQVNG